MMLGSSFNSQHTKASRLSSSNELNFPIDLLIEILKRVPLKSLIRLTCVCKSWHSLLTSPTFISAHVSHNFAKINDGKSRNLHLFRQAIDVRSKDCRSEFYLFNTKTVSKPRKIKCPVGRKHFIVSSRDGLLCFFDFFSQNPETAPLILWNPSIKRMEVVRVPANRDVELTPGGFPKLIFGFGLDPISNDYMVVRIAYFNGCSGSTRFRADMYGLGGGKWRGFDMSSVCQNLSTIRWRGVCLNGVIHWVCNVNVSFDDNDLVLRSILTFELGSGKFGEIELPKELSNVKNQTVRVMAVPRGGNEVLGVIHKFGDSLSLWVMDKYGIKESWAKLFCGNIVNVVGNDINVGLISEEVVVVQMLSGYWFSHDVRTDERKVFRRMLKSTNYVDTYVESLILLGQGSVWPRKKLS
uniref:F-box domain-containing protein n=2 Tax=Opuntia streptacantha TaxID=393608 RepID=A0A7C9CI64_OPUST